MSAPAEPLSVVIPAWNAARYLADAVASVLAEGDAVTEIVVVDDGSTDDTAAIAAALPKVRVVAQPNRGIAAARNHGVRASTGALLAFIDADDLWTPGRLARQLAALADDPDAVVLGHSDEFVSPDLAPAAAAALRPKPGRSPGFLAGAMIMRRATFERVGFFDERLPVAEVVAWFQRATELGVRQHVLPALVLSRRLHADNFTRSRDSRSDYVLCAAQMIAKKRAAAEAAAAKAAKPDGDAG